MAFIVAWAFGLETREADCGGCQPTPMVDDMITPKGVTLFDMILGFPSIVGNDGCLAQCAGSLPKLWQLTIGLTNIYYKWAIKLFGNYKESMMIRNVCWMCYKSDGKFMTKHFIVYLKIRLLKYV